MQENKNAAMAFHLKSHIKYIDKKLKQIEEKRPLLLEKKASETRETRFLMISDDWA